MSQNVRVITTFQFVCPVTSNGVVSRTTLPIGASALPRAVNPVSSSPSPSSTTVAATTTTPAVTTPVPANVGGGVSTIPATLTTPAPQDVVPSPSPSATPMTTAVLTTLSNGDISSFMMTTTIPPSQPTAGPRTFGIIPFTTTLTVDVFPSPRPTDLNAYLPAYAAIPDGSLVTPLYLESSMREHIRIFITGALLMLFLRNIVASIDYLRRTKSRDRTLFWLLLFSQMWGPVRFIPIAAGFFSKATDCRAIQIISFLALEISYSVLITFILGMKAYRCLKRSRVVLGVVGALQISAYVIYLIGLQRIGSERSLSGNCVSTGQRPLLALAVSLQFIESGFIFGCFLYAVIKSSRRSATKGRMSIALSSAPGVPPEMPASAPQGVKEPVLTPGLHEKRGWWDYVPEEHVGVGVGGPGGPGFTSSKYPTGAEQGAVGDPHALSVERWRERIVSTIWRRADTPAGPSRPVSPGAPPVGMTNGAPRKSSIHSDEPIPHPDRAAFGDASEKRWAEGDGTARQMPDLALIDSRTGLATGVESTKSRARSRGKPAKLTQSLAQRNRLSSMMWMPKMMLLRAVMKDELLYTAMIALSCVVSAVGLVLGGGRSGTMLGASAWLEINWAVVSVLVMRSFYHVIARQERDAVLQDPTAWNVAVKTDTGLGRSPVLRRGAMDYGFSQARAQRGVKSFVSRRSDISSRAFYRSPQRPPSTLSVSDYGSAIERARRADDLRPPVRPLPDVEIDDPFSDFERIVDMPRSREPGSPVASSIGGVRNHSLPDDDDEPGPSDSISQAPSRRRGPPTIVRRAATDYSTEVGTMSMIGIVPARSIRQGPPSPHGSGSRNSSAYEPSFVDESPMTPIGPRMTHS
ncbi:hypothetical protein BDV93DRAFT_71247 [Ceratobasidium sp. AG-I]|nr:hypothetical protein BDV93DRAFT_71247 [Ceratobasidium sp. AG-I]